MPKDPPKPNDTPCRLVLIVDDNHEILEMVSRVLEHYGIKSTIAVDSAAGALQILQTQEVALIITDVRMPDIDGLELLRLVRRDYPRTRRLIFTGRETAEIVDRGNELAHRSLLLKPLVGGTYNFFMAVDHELELYRLATAEGEKTNGSNGHATNR